MTIAQGALVVALGLLAGCQQARESQTVTDAERQAILEPIEALFAAMTARDATAGAALIHNRGMGFAISAEGAERGDLRALPMSDLVASFAISGPPVVERIRDAEIRIDGPLATVWAPYDFWLDGTLHHCGTDAFQLMHGANGWRIVNVAWTRRDESCGDSPPGPSSGTEGA